MATINFEVHGPRTSGKGGPPVLITGKSTASIPGYADDRVLYVTAANTAALGVPPGTYEQCGADASGNRTYKLAM